MDSEIMGLERFSLVSLFSPFPQASEEIGIGSLSLKDSFLTSSAHAYRISCSLGKREFLESRDRVNQLQSLLSKACRSVEHCFVFSFLWLLYDTNQSIT